MRRRSLFAGLAGLLAAPKVAAAAPAEPAGRWSPWIVGKTVRLNTSWHAVQRHGGPVEWKLPDGVLAHEVHIIGAGGQAAAGTGSATPGDELTVEVGTPATSQPGPIGVTWAGYQDADPRAPVSPRADARGRRRGIPPRRRPAYASLAAPPLALFPGA